MYKSLYSQIRRKTTNNELNVNFKKPESKVELLKLKVDWVCRCSFPVTFMLPQFLFVYLRRGNNNGQRDLQKDQKIL